MADSPPLRPATIDELTDTLAFGLRFNGRKKAHTANEFMAYITAERLAEHLRISGFVVMKKPPSDGIGPSTTTKARSISDRG